MNAFGQWIARKFKRGAPRPFIVVQNIVSSLERRIDLAEQGIKVHEDATKMLSWVFKENATVLRLVSAQLRHAYKQLSDGAVVNQKEFADGLLSPNIKFLEATCDIYDKYAALLDLENKNV